MTGGDDPRALVSCRRLSKAFLDGETTRLVLHGLDFDLQRAEVLCVRGRSGSGKSTLLNLVAGLISADTGTLVFRYDERARPYAAMSDSELRAIRRRHIGYLFQFFNLLPTLTVAENVCLPLDLNDRPDLRERALGRLEEMGLGPRADAYPHALSGGEQQRVAVARALAHEPALLLADEPTGNLDADNARLVADVLWREVRASGCAMLIATHDDALAARSDAQLLLDG